jgi:hypothetical protein
MDAEKFKVQKFNVQSARFAHPELRGIKREDSSLRSGQAWNLERLIPGSSKPVSRSAGIVAFPLNMNNPR